MSVSRNIMLYGYEEKIIIMPQVNKKERNVSKIARKYNIAESTIRKWFMEAGFGNLRKDGRIILYDMQKINIQTTEMKMVSEINHCISVENKIAKLIPFLMENGFSFEDSLELLNISRYEYEKCKRELNYNMELCVTTKYFHSSNKEYENQNNELEKIMKKTLTEAGKRRDVYRFNYTLDIDNSFNLEKIDKLQRILEQIPVIQRAYIYTTNKKVIDLI